jgi:hypothetical protein
MADQKDQAPASPSASQGGQLQVKVTDEVLKGVYANMVQVGHTPEEFILDFMNLFPPTGIITSRVVISPGHMKRIVAALADNLKRYEQQFGSIKTGAPSSDPTITSSSDHRIGFDTNKAS